MPGQRQKISDFNPRSPWGERPGLLLMALLRADFNPRSPWGERLPEIHIALPAGLFQSTLPVGGATPAVLSKRLCKINFNPRSPWGERPVGRPPEIKGLHFNPRSPWGERHVTHSTWLYDVIFQSTLPVGGATRLLHMSLVTY